VPLDLAVVLEHKVCSLRDKHISILMALGEIYALGDPREQTADNAILWPIELRPRLVYTFQKHSPRGL